MWVHTLFEPCTRSSVLDDLVDTAWRQGLVSSVPFTALGQKDVIRGAVVRPALDQTSNPAQRLRRYRDVSQLASFPQHTQVRLASRTHDVGSGEPRQLFDPQTAVAEDPDDELVSLAP